MRTGTSVRRRKRMGTPWSRYALFGICVLIVLGALFFQSAVADAHALLVRSEPAAGAELTTAPATIELWFSEPLEPAFSQAHLVDMQGNEIGRGASTVDEADPMHLTLTLTELPPGIYTVVYRNLSQADGHEWVGSFPLTLLNPDGSRPAGAATMDMLGDMLGTELPTPLKTVSRWLALLGAMLLTGVLVFQQLGPALRQAEPQDSLSVRIEQHGRIGLVVGIGLVFVGSWLQVFAQMAALSGMGSAGGVTLDLFFQTRAGALLFTRQLLAGALLFLTIVVTGFADKLRSAGQWLALLLSLAILATFSVGSHAAAVAGSGWAIVGDFIHLAAAAIWLGGLLLLAVLLWQHRQQSAGEATLLRQVVWRFSVVATLAVFVLVVTGLFSSLVQLQSWSLLWTTAYGRLLLIKGLLVVVILGVALLNHRLVRINPASGSAVSWAATYQRPLRRQVWGESLSGLLLMVVVALLVQTPVPQPAATVAPAPTSFFETILAADDLTIHLQISPNRVGDNRYLTHLYHADGSPIGEVQLVRLLFAHQTADLGQATLELTAQGGDLFEAAGAYLSQAGSWDLSIYVRRRGMDDILAPTTVDVPAPTVVVTPARDPWQNPITTLPAVVVVVGILAALGLAPLIWRRATQADIHHHT